MRWSQLYVPTLRDDPAEADAVSHRLLLRAGFIRPLHAGHYTLLPLAVRVRANIIAILRAEMARIGAQELLLPTMHPAELWRRGGRLDRLGDEMFRLRDRRGTELALGMTHEEIFAAVASELSSYRQLPQIWYQIQTKFRDEPRPRAGLLRTREFTMKDSYSFDVGPDGLDRAFDAHAGAYARIFARLGIPVVPVRASSGTMGGSESTEFMCPSAAGEDEMVRCADCGYAANLEAATSSSAAVADGPGLPAPERFATPGARTIEDLRARYDAAPDRQIKTLVYVVDGQLTLVLLRGDHTLLEVKLVDRLGATDVRPAQPDEIRAALGAAPGSLGAVGVTGLPIVADQALRGRRAMFTGANTDDVHLRGVDVDRDIAVGRWAELREVVAGEPCPRCGTPLGRERAVEVGHIFKLGYAYSDAFGATVLDAEGRRTRLIMGSYGIGVERAMAAIVECHHDDRGIVWPMAVAPFTAAIVVTQPDDAEVAHASNVLYDDLRRAGVEVVLDDRPERAGVKFRDVELTGIPLRITIGRRGLAAGIGELTIRVSGSTEPVPLPELVRRVVEARAAGYAEGVDPVP